MNGNGTLQTSNEIAEIAAALAEAQGEYPPITKDKEADAGTYKYKYADLGDVLAAIRPVLAKHGLALIQPTIIDAGTIFVRSRVIHKSGQWIESEFPVAAYSGARHQQVGAALSYARRYAACSLLSIAAEEDTDADSNIGDTKPKREGRAREAPTVVQSGDPRPLPPTVGESREVSPEPSSDGVDPRKHRMIESSMRACISVENLDAFVATQPDVGKSESLTSIYESLRAELSDKPPVLMP